MVQHQTVVYLTQWRCLSRRQTQHMSCIPPPPHSFADGALKVVHLHTCNHIIIIFYISYCVGLSRRILALVDWLRPPLFTRNILFCKSGKSTRILYIIFGIYLRCSRRFYFHFVQGYKLFS